MMFERFVFGRALSGFTGAVFGADEKVFWSLFDGNEFSYGDRIAVRFQKEAARHVGEQIGEAMFEQSVFCERVVGDSVDLSGQFVLAARRYGDVLGFVGDRQSQRLIRGGVAGVQSDEQIDFIRQPRGPVGRAFKLHFFQVQPFGSLLALLYALLNDVDSYKTGGTFQYMANVPEQYEAEVRLPASAIHDDVGFGRFFQRQMRAKQFDEMIDLFELLAHGGFDFSLRRH